MSGLQSRLFLRSGETLKRKLPSYVFDQKAYFIEKQDDALFEKNHLTKRAHKKQNIDITTWGYEDKIEKLSLLDTDYLEALADENWLIFANDELAASDFVVRLKKAQASYSLVIQGDNYEELENHGYICSFREEDLKKLRLSLPQERTPTRIIHLNTLAASGPQKILTSGLMAILNLCKVFDEATCPDLTIEVLTDRLFEGVGMKPEKSLLEATSKVLPKEFLGRKIGLVDISDGQYIPMASDFWKKQNKILMREKDVYISRLARSSFDVSSLKIRFGATYLITGGLGGIGLSIAHELWTKYQANIILVSRKSYSSLSEVLKNKVIGDHERAIIKAFTKDRSQRVLLLSGDVSVEGSTQECIDKGIQEFGAIHGVIHSAGVIDDGPALLKTEASIDRVLSAKVSGCLNLERALDKQPLDFFVVFSSTSSNTAPADNMITLLRMPMLKPLRHLEIRRQEVLTTAILISYRLAGICGNRLVWPIRILDIKDKTKSKLDSLKIY